NNVAKVLVADANASNRQWLKEIINYFGIECELAGSALEAMILLDKLNQTNQLPGLIICDQHMPEIDGIQFIKELRNHSVFSRLPVSLMLSSLEKNLYENEADKLRVNYLLTKPVKLYELYSFLCSLSSGEEMHAEAKQDSTVIEKFADATTIMVVEDDPINMMLISEVLRKMGFKVIKASN